jgi:benzoate 4-monooxygenase
MSGSALLSSSLIPVLGSVLVAYFCYGTLYSVFLSPLKKVPGPWWAAWSKWPMVFATVRGKRSVTIHKLHDTYGQWVRIAPNEISISDPQAIVPIYGTTSKFAKTDFYTYQLRGIPELFTMSNQKRHADRRKLLAHLFSMSTMKDYEPIISENVKKCMDYIEEQGSVGATSNLYD